MQISVSGHHVDLTVPLKEYVNTKFAKVLERFDSISSIHVTLSIENHHEQHAEAAVMVPGSKCFAKVSGHDMYTAIDQLSVKIHKQLVHLKSEAKSRLHIAPLKKSQLN